MELVLRDTLNQLASLPEYRGKILEVKTKPKSASSFFVLNIFLLFPFGNHVFSLLLLLLLRLTWDSAD